MPCANLHHRAQFPTVLRISLSTNKLQKSLPNGAGLQPVSPNLLSVLHPTVLSVSLSTQINCKRLSQVRLLVK